MPEVFTQKYLDDLDIELLPVDPEGCKGCPAHEKGAFATKGGYFSRGAHGERRIVRSVSYGDICNYSRTSVGGALTVYDVHCVQIENPI